MATMSEKLREPQRTWTGLFRDYPDGRTEGPFHPVMIEAADLMDEMAKALEPFGLEADQLEGFDASEHLVEGWPSGPSSSLTVGNLIRARAILTRFREAG